MRIAWMLAAGVLSLATLGGHDIITTKLTFSRDISRIFARRCQACHGVEASIPLTTYELARPWAVSIKEQVLSRQMPPWGAVKGFGHFSPDIGLNQEEIMLIAAWVVGGAPKGNPALLPPAPAPNQSPAEGAPMKDALVIRTKSRIERRLAVTGIRPLATELVESARIVVNYPDGHVEPLLWLYHYRPEWRRVYRFRETIRLPPGSVVESGAPLQFALEKNR
jgi:hypothetical protein